MNCPICAGITSEKYKPFCSKRCSYIDLSNWLGEKYTISVNEDDFDNNFNIDK